MSDPAYGVARRVFSGCPIRRDRVSSRSALARSFGFADRCGRRAAQNAAGSHVSQEVSEVTPLAVISNSFSAKMFVPAIARIIATLLHASPTNVCSLISYL